MKNDRKVVIVIPVYKDCLSELEKISLLQLQKMLGEFDKIFIKPDSLEVDFSEIVPGAKYISFNDVFFKSTRTYSRLLLSPEFYKSFLEYEYMLIYQTDVFVFRNDLLDFCDMGYDYIGAPFLEGSAMFRDSHSYVGNGGFSLRNVKKCLKVVRENQKLIFEKFFPDLSRYGEDIFFSYCGALNISDFNVAPVEVAQCFSLESNFHGLMENFPQTLPFGCHNWYRFNFAYWKKFIEGFGYSFDSSKCEEASEDELSQISEYLERIEYFLFNYTEDYLRNVGRTFFFLHKNRHISIRGIGNYGQRLYDILSACGIEIYKVYDISDKKNIGIEVNSISDMSPRDDEVVIVSQLHTGTSIRMDMERMGWKYRNNVFQIREILMELYSIISSKVGNGLE